MYLKKYWWDLLYFHIMVLHNNRNCLPSNIKLFFNGYFCYIESDLGGTMISFNNKVFDNKKSPSLSLKKLVKKLIEILHPYYQLGYKNIFLLFQNIFKESEYYPSSYGIRKISDSKYELIIGNESYHSWLVGDKYYFKTMKNNKQQERIADLNGFIQYFSTKNYIH